MTGRRTHIRVPFAGRYITPVGDDVRLGGGARRDRPPTRRAGRSRLGEQSLERLVPQCLEPRAHDRHRELRDQRDLPGLGERRAHDGVLLRRRARDQTRAGRGRAQRRAEGPAPGARRARRHARAGAHLPRVESRRRRQSGLGHPDGDRPRVRARRARTAGIQSRSGPEAVPAHAGDRRRHRRHHRHRRLLLGRDRRGVARWCRGRACTLFPDARAGRSPPALVRVPGTASCGSARSSRGSTPPSREWRSASSLPRARSDDRRVLEQLERRLHLWTSFLVVPRLRAGQRRRQRRRRRAPRRRHRAASPGESSAGWSSARSSVSPPLPGSPCASAWAGSPTV